MSVDLVELTVEDPGWDEAVPDLHEISTVAATLALNAVNVAVEDFSVSVLACDDDRIGALNGAFRDKLRPTNVLSWPAVDLSPEAPGGDPAKPVALPFGDATSLGDVAIALQTCIREANAASMPLKNHVTHLILHACLHLLGFDHETEADADRMEEVERAALASIGIPDPYR